MAIASFGSASRLIFLRSMTSVGWVQEVGSFGSGPEIAGSNLPMSAIERESNPTLSRELP